MPVILIRLQCITRVLCLTLAGEEADMSFSDFLRDSSETARKRWLNLPIVQKWHDAYINNKYDPTALAVGRIGANIIFLYLSFSLLYVTLEYSAYDFYQEYGDWAILLANIFHVFAAFNVLSNWFCIKWYQSKYKASAHVTSKTHNALLDHVIDIESTGSEVIDKDATGMRIVHRNADGTNAASNIYLRASNGHASNGTTGPQLLEGYHCDICNHDAPPRAHHCPVCQKCILKRDHHCFMLGVCIGHFNQRFFVIFASYMSFGCFYGKYLQYHYLSKHFFPNCYYTDLFLPWTVIRAAFDDLPPHILFMLSHIYFLWIGGVLGISFVVQQFFVIIMGKTTNEAFRKRGIRSHASIVQHFRDVFGEYWPINFLFPAHIWFPQRKDGTCWDKVYQTR